MSELASLFVTVHGLVQGVNFRSFVMRYARAPGLTGYVRNLASGEVEVRAEGEKQKLEELLNHLKNGPPRAVVDRVDVEWSEYSGLFSYFEVRY